MVLYALPRTKARGLRRLLIVPSHLRPLSSHPGNDQISFGVSAWVVQSAHLKFRRNAHDDTAALRDKAEDLLIFFIQQVLDASKGLNFVC